MEYKIKMVIILLLVLFIYNNKYKFKRIKRRMIIKKMEVDENINDLIDEFKRNMKDNTELKTIQNKLRIIQIAKYMSYLILIIVPIIVPVLITYIYYKIEFKKENLIIDELFNNMAVIYIFFFITAVIASIAIDIYNVKTYIKNKNVLKKYIFNDFLRNLTYDIKWYDEYNPIISKKTYKMLDIDITWEEIYKKANFNKIQFDENIYQNTLSSKMLSTKEINFEDYITGIYKEKYIILISDFQELTITRRNFYRKIRHITNEGIFCVMKMDKNILNSIRITNDKKNSFSIEKQYVVTTMPEKFYKNFIILAKDGYKISEKISDKSIEIIKNFYDKSKIKFDISIINDEIFFKFKTIDSMELNRWRNVVDDLMLKEYANIIMFVIKLSEEINNNWK